MKTIVVIYSGDDWGVKEPLAKNKSYNHIAKNYKDWCDYSEKRGILVVRASIQWYNERTGKFSKYWMYDGQEWKKVRKAIKPDVVYDKTMSDYRIDTSPILRGMIKKGIKVFNHPAFRDRFANKLSDLRYWSEIMPDSIIVFNKVTAKSIAERHFGKKRLVAKEIFGSGGKNVYIGKTDEINFGKVKYPLVVQEFMKSTGAPGLDGTVSDLRLEFLDHKFFWAFSRVAVDGLYTNTNKGASLIRMRKKDIPKEVMELVKQVQKTMRGFKNCQYALDFYFTKDGPKLIESANVPGFGIAESIGTKREREWYFKKINAALLRGL